MNEDTLKQNGTVRPRAALVAESMVAGVRAMWIWGAAVAVLALLLWFLIGTKIRTMHAACPVDDGDDAGLFWTESAFHYRYARMVAAGRPLPETDYAMQYPEGIDVFRDEMPVMEVVGGRLYRWFTPSGKPFHIFLLELVCVYSSFILVPAFLLSAGTFRRATAALTTTLFYLLTFPAIGSVVLFAYVRQDFALPVLFLASALWLIGIDRQRSAWQTLGAFVMAAAFASWHLSQFYYTVLLTGCAAAWLVRPEWRSAIARGVGIMTIVLVAAGLVVPALRSGWLPAATPLLLAYALLLTHVLWTRRRFGRLIALLCLAGLFAVFWLGSAASGAGHLERYSHVYRLMWDKIRFLGIKPEDPTRMCFESRVMWTSSFLSPTWWSVRRWMGGAWIAAGWGWVAMLRDVRRRGLRFLEALLLWMAACFIALYLLIQRMDVFAAFFVCVVAGRMAPQDSPARSLRALLTYVVLIVLLAYSWHNITSLYMVSGAPPPKQLRPLIEAIRRYTQTNDVILAHFPLSPVICAHTDRPVVIHSKFENRRVREKVREFYAAFFEREEALHRVCRIYNVRYVVHEPEIALSVTRESIRYMVARMDLTDEAVSVRMQFLPESLRWFQLVFQTERYRVYRVLDAPREPGPVPFPSLPIYDSRNFRREDVRIRER